MSTNTQVTAFVSDISASRLSDAEEAGLVDIELAALQCEALTQVDNSARGDVTGLLGWLT
ncbi:MAG: hypothetical protein WBR28_31825 [Mycobacterium sp.]